MLYYLHVYAATLRGLTYFIVWSFNAVPGNYSIPNSLCGEAQDILVAFLYNFYQRCPDCVSYAWFIHSQCEHGCGLDFRHITLDLLCSTLSCYGGHLCYVVRFNNW